MNTVNHIIRGQDKYWQLKPSNSLSSIEILAWHAASDLAAFVEMTYQPEDIQKSVPDTFTVLWGIQSYFEDLGELPSQSLALVMHMIDRVNWGLTAGGDDTKRPT